MLVRFWGTRGSLPVALKADAVREKLVTALMAAGGRRFEDSEAAGRFIDDELDFAESGTYGGASACVELEGGDGEFVVFDMGSGLREFALSAMQRTGAGRSKVYNFFLSHLHWDHIMGFPFFAPTFDPEAEVRIYGGHRELELALRRQQEKISFPVPFGWLKAKFTFTTLEPGETYDIAGYRVGLFRQAHDNDSFGYRLESAGKSVVYSTDGEYKAEDRGREDAFVGFIDKADLVVFDTMYSLAEAVSMKEDWGHSSNVTAVDLCHRAAVKRLAMFHHEPVNDDRAIRQIHRDTIRYEELMRQGAPLEVLCSYDGLELSI